MTSNILLIVSVVERLIRECQQEAELAIAEGNPPFGCVTTDSGGHILVRAHNQRNTRHDPTAHAEILALRKMSERRKSWKLDDCFLFANAESCPMCLSAGVKALIRDFYFGAQAESTGNPAVTVQEIASRTTPEINLTTGILAAECAQQIARGRQRAT